MASCVADMASIAARSSLFEPIPSLSSSPKRGKLALEEIKSLYIQRQYKRCVARSSSILESANGSGGTREPIHAVHRTYLYFYSGISYEAMGQYAHVYSRNKIPLLHNALDCFVACLAGLPDFASLEEDQVLDLVEGDLESHVKFGTRGAGYGEVFLGLCGDETGVSEGEEEPELGFWLPKDTRSISVSPYPSPSPSPSASTPESRTISPTDSIVSSITDIIDKTLCCPDDDPFLSDDEGRISTTYLLSTQSLQLDHKGADTIALKEKTAEIRLMPSPLHVRKSFKPLPLITPSLSSSGVATVCSLPPGESQVQTKVPTEIRVPTPSRLPLPIKPAVPFPIMKTRKVKAKSHITKPTNSISSKAKVKSIKSYNASILSLHGQLTSTITSLKSYIQETTTLQNAHAASKSNPRNNFQRPVSFWSFSPVKSPSKSRARAASGFGSTVLCRDRNEAQSSPSSGYKRETIKERVVRLRRDGWETVGLRNGKRGWKGQEYYREFCGQALDELYLDV
ncbi:hypothetical protein BJY04DRAFT_38433 [Aspergillus karnatakaensis]|uniref:uncharacterized protein n=1 Tax=Aspergillus karnatakaensis TaxID=1810916 RepID=UPI003CCDA7BC